MGIDILRFATAGSVDDGKSTLIGRLLYDTKSLFSDQLEAVERTSRQRGDEYTDLALLTDGLRAEREQGITIDVAYRYFATLLRVPHLVLCVNKMDLVDYSEDVFESVKAEFREFAAKLDIGDLTAIP